MFFEEYRNKFAELKSRIILERNISLLRGMFLIMISLVAFIGDPFITDFTFYWIFPIIMMYFGAETLYLASETKKFGVKEWVMQIGVGYLFVALAFYFIFAPVSDPQEMLVYLGIFSLVKVIVNLSTIPNKMPKDYTGMLIAVIVSFFVIAFPNIFSTVLYWATLAITLIYGIYKLCVCYALNNIIIKGRAVKAVAKESESKPVTVKKAPVKKTTTVAKKKPVAKKKVSILEPNQK